MYFQKKRTLWKIRDNATDDFLKLSQFLMEKYVSERYCRFRNEFVSTE